MFNLTTKAYIAVTEAFRQFKQDQRGVTAIEYGLIALAMAAFIVLIFNKDGTFISKLTSKFNELSNTVNGFKVDGSK